MRRFLPLVLLLAACPGGGPAGSRCEPERAALDRTEQLRAGGWLHQGLDAAEAEQRRCPSAAAGLAVAAALADLGLDARAIAAYRAAAAHGGATATTAATAIAELEKRPPPTRKPTAAEAEQARALYRDGVNLRLDGRADDAIRQLRRAYALAPHPLTIVQISMAHRAAGREVEARKASARALALAEATRGGTATHRLRGGHVDEIHAVAFHPRRPLLASASSDGTARVWDLTTGRAIHVLPHGNPVTGLAFAGETLITLVEQTGELRAWDAAAGTPLSQVALSGAPSRLAAAGDLVAVGGFGVDLFELSTGRKRTAIHATALHSLDLSPDGKLLATYASLGDQVDLHDAASGADLGQLPAGSDANAVLAFSPDSKELAVGSGGQLTLWSVADRRVLARLAMPGSIQAVAFHPDGERVVVGGPGWAEIRALAGGPGVALTGIDVVDALAVSPDGARIAAAGRIAATDQVVLPVWSIDGGAPARILASPGLPAGGLWFGGDGELFAGGVAAGAARLWRSSHPEQRTQVPADEVFGALAVDPGSLRMAAGDDEYAAAVWDPRTGALVRTLPLDAPARELAVSRDGNRIAVMSSWHEVVVHDAGGARLHAAPVGARAALALSADGNRLLISDSDGQAAWDVGGGRRWSLALGEAKVTPAGDLALVAIRARTEVIDAATGAVLRSLPPGAATLAADGTVIARAAGAAVLVEDARTGGARGRLAASARTGALAVAGDRVAVQDATDHWIRIWDWRRGRMLQAWAGRAERLSAMVLSADGTRLVTRGDTVRLWNCLTGAELMSAPHGWNTRAELSADGALLAIGDLDALTIHDARTGAALRSLGGSPPLAWTGDGTLLVSGRSRSVARIGGLDGGPLRVLGVGRHRLRALAFAGAGRLAALSGERDLGLWDVDGERAIWTWAGGGRIEQLLAPSAGGRWFALADRRVLAIDAAGGDPLGATELGVSLTGAAVRDDGGLLAVATRSGPGAAAPLRLLGPDLAERGRVQVAGEIRELRFAPDGKWLAGGGYDQIELWALPGGAGRILKGHRGRIEAITFRADGRLLATAAEDRTIKLWRLPGGEPVATIVGALDGPLAVVAADGRVDGTEGDDGGAALLSWQVGDVTLPGFVGWQRYRQPGLLAELLR